MVVWERVSASRCVSTDQFTDAGFYQKAPRLSDCQKGVDKSDLDLYFRDRATPHASSSSVSA